MSDAVKVSAHKTSLVSVRFNARQRAAIAAKAEELGLPAAAFIRLAAINATGVPQLARRELAKIQSLLTLAPEGAPENE